jgi:hypothetical protein
VSCGPNDDGTGNELALLLIGPFSGGMSPMMLDLSQADARMLEEVLQNYLPDLKREVARTEVKTLRHELVQRQELCERLLERLASPMV